VHNPDDVAACLRVLARAAERPDDPALAAGRLGDDGTAVLADALRLAEAAGELELLGLGSGVPRRMERAAARLLREPGPAPDDVRAITSVYR
jgi:hypothetical protein